MSSKNEIEKAASKQKAKQKAKEIQKKSEETPVDCQFMEAELQYMYGILDEHAPTKLGRPLQDKMNRFVIEHREKFSKSEEIV